MEYDLEKYTLKELRYKLERLEDETKYLRQELDKYKNNLNKNIF